MAMAIRCGRCGKLLELEDEAVGWLRCPECGTRLDVPPLLATLPRPHVRPDGRLARTQARAWGLRPAARAAAGITAMAAAMPWVFSALLHVGLFLLMLFVVLMQTVPGKALAVPVTMVSLPPRPAPIGGFLDADPRNPHDGPDRQSTSIRRHPPAPPPVDPGDTKESLKGLLAPGGNSSRNSSDDPMGPRDRSGGIYGIRWRPHAGGAQNVVYVVDRSGSMADKFDGVRMELTRSVSRLPAQCSFHIIFFNANQLTEGPGKRLVPATDDNRVAAAHFVDKQTVSGATTVLPALKRAFEVLRAAPQDSPGKLIYLLSDGDFAGVTGGSSYQPAGRRTLTGNEAVIQWLRDNNRSVEAIVNTILLHCEDRSAVEVMRTIAQDNHGEFKQIGPDGP